MDYLMDSEMTNEEFEIDTGLIFRKDHLSWLIDLMNSVPEADRSDTPQFCVSCSRYLNPGEDTASHKNQPAKGPHHVLQLVRSHSKVPNVISTNFYISVQTLRELQVPIGDVQSHILPHPHPHHRPDAAGDGADRCVYIQPQNVIGPIKLGNVDIYSGRCAYRECEKVFYDRQSHLRLYGITPQFCSISCKLNTWLLL